ncbi:MAG TPA: hypothetical protein VFA04_04545, partial [Bryobacteraceae bacterium]|nr:hypothetical protein [Bryobacteraceae bacterium]
MSNVPEPGDSHGPLMPHAHWDVQVPPFITLKATPRGEAAILLKNSSPFMACTVAATPTAPTRDLSTNVGSLLTAVGTIGAVPAAVPFGPEALVQSDSALTLQERVAALPPLPASDIEAIQQSIDRLGQSANTDYDAIQDAYRSFRTAVRKDWKFTFSSDVAVANAIDDLKNTIRAVQRRLDVFAGVGLQLDQIDAALAQFQKDTLPSRPDLAQKFRDAQNHLIATKARIALLKDHLSDTSDKRKLMVQIWDFLSNLDPATFTEQVLPMAYFSGKQVTETISCKDAITKDPAFDNIVFTAYYEAVPHLDLSVGAIASLLGGRQLATTTGPFTPGQAASCAGAAAGSPPCGPTSVLGYKGRSSYQFMPGVFVEWRMANFHCPWAKNGAPWHPAGYVCSVGLAGGVAINPNNGGPAAEFFEGLSFGIQRFAIMVGVHNGRYQDYGG